jgi:hypothetical protein
MKMKINNERKRNENNGININIESANVCNELIMKKAWRKRRKKKKRYSSISNGHQ